MNINLDEPNSVKEPMLVDEPKHMVKKVVPEDQDLEGKSEPVQEEKKPYPKMNIEWTNVICDKLIDGKTKPYHILIKPNKIMCGGISVINNHQTIAGLHRKECWDNEDPCCEWPDSHNPNNLIEYSKEDKILKIRLDSYVWNREGDTHTFDWSLFCSEAEDFCFESGLKKLLKIFDL